jgi:site-specific recombinase XerD
LTSFDPELRLHHSSDELAFLGELVSRQGSHKTWRTLVNVLSLADLPGMTQAVMENGLSALTLIEEWTGEPTSKVAEVAAWAIRAKSLSTLTSTSTLTRHGSVGGGFVGEHPLRAALSMLRRPAEDEIAAPLLAIGLIQQMHSPAAVVGINIGRAVHNQQSPEWTKVLRQLPLISNRTSASYLDSLISSCAAICSEPDLRTVDRRFLKEVEAYANFALDKLSEQTARFRSEIVTGTQLFEVDDPEGESTLSRHEVTWRIDPTEENESGEPEILYFVDEHSAPDALDVSDKSGLAGPSARQLRAAFRSQSENQHSEFHWRSLAPPETSFVLREAWKSLRSDVVTEGVTGAIFLLSLVLGKTPEASAEICVSAAGDDDGICLSKNCYRRRIPEPPQSWKPSDEHRDALAVADSIELALPSPVLELLRLRLPANARQRELWFLGWPNLATCINDLKEWMNDRKDRHRLTPRRLARVVPNRVFADCGRQAVIYWLFQSADDPPPSGVYYTAYPITELRRLHFQAWATLFESEGIQHHTESPGRVEQRVGSHMQIPPAAVRSMAGFLHKAIGKQKSDLRSLVHAHNTYTAYALSLLNFGTGHRPTTDPFDAFEAISIEEGYALIDDKYIDAQHSARLVPLSPLVIQQIQYYFDHLHSLAEAIRSWYPTLSDRILIQLEKRYQRILPVFFFLGNSDAWTSVRSSLLATYFPPGWHYPPNAHRHFLASQLSLRGIDEYVINQLMGHVDAGTASISGLSRYSPSDVFVDLRQTIDELLKSCNFQPCASPLKQSTRYELSYSNSKSAPQSIFGREQRAKTRKHKEEIEKSFVQETLEAYVESKPNGEPLSSEDIRALIALVQDRSVTVAFRHDQVRMSALRQQLASLKKRTGAQFFIPRERLLLNRQSEFFQEKALAHALLANHLKRDFAEHLCNLAVPLPESNDEATDRGSRPNPNRRQISNTNEIPKPDPRLRFAYGIMSLIVFARLADSKAICEHILAGNYLVHDGVGEVTYLEFGINSKNVRRIPLDEATAHLLLPAPRSAPTEVQLDAALRGILGRLRGTYVSRGRQSAVLQLCRLIDARNRLDLAGQLADYLSGASYSAALPHLMWVRTQHHRAAPDETAIPANDLLDLEPAAESSADLPPVRPKRDNVDSSVFTKAITKVLSHGAQRSSFEESAYRDHTKGGYAKPEKVARLEGALRHLAKGGELAPIGVMASSWIKRLMTHGSTGGPVVLNTIRRYWAELKREVIPLAYQLTVEEINAGALEDVYREAIDRAEQHQELVRKVLGLFHQHIESNFGVTTVDWSEVLPEGFSNDGDIINPSIISDRMYFHAIDLLKKDQHVQNKWEREAAALLVVLMYRFGLRTSEARGLLLRDVFHHKHRYFLRIAPNFARKIKTDAGIRFVPAIEALTEAESKLIAQFCEAGKAMRSHDSLTPLFANEAHSRDLNAMIRVCSRAADAIACVAASSGYSLYALRHSFISRVHFQISERNATSTLFLSPRRDTHGEHLNRLLAIVSGHVSPATTLKHYCHKFDQLLELPYTHALDRERLLRVIGAVTSRDKTARDTTPWRALSRLPEYQLPEDLPEPRIRPAAQVGAVEQAVRFLRLTSYGTELASIASLLNASAHQISEMDASLSRLETERPIGSRQSFDFGDADFGAANQVLRTNYWMQLLEAGRRVDVAFIDTEKALKISSLAKGWFRYVVSLNHDLLLDPLGDMSPLLTLLEILEVSKADVLIQLAQQDSSCDWFTKAITIAHSAGFGVEEASRMNRPAVQIGRKRTWPRCAVSMRRLREGCVRSTPQLSMLLVAIWISLDAPK